MEAVLAGDAPLATALGSALGRLGVETRTHASDGLADSLTEIERELERGRPEVAVAVGSGEEALALAITAAKAEVPVAHMSSRPDPGDASRAITTLSGLDAGDDPARAADLIAAWIRGDQPPPDLD